MQIASVVSQFSMEIQSISGIKSQMTGTLEARPDEGETWTLEQARHAHILLAENTVKEVFTGMVAEGALEPKEAVSHMGKMAERFKAIRVKREQALAEIVHKTKSEEIHAY